jgi:L-alanine-DL-glutamate epimerase-like enolase superfamily enzyme
MRIASIKLYRLSQPLSEPYHLSYRSIFDLDSLWAKVELENGRMGWGESTPLPGYSESDMDAVWTVTNNLAGQWIGKSAGEILGRPLREQDGFLFTALWTALEEATGSIPLLEGLVPLVGLVQERKGEPTLSAVQGVRKLGYKVFKVKVGYLSVDDDIKRLTLLQNELLHDELIRVDANQALSEVSAAKILEVCILGKIELFEQPLPIDDWAGCARLARISAVPIMLDESITDLDTLEKTAEIGAARIVKLKWMKQGGRSYLLAMVKRARELNLRVVLGNGVAGAVNNRQEALFWLDQLRDIQLAGEMNGYLKIKNRSALLGFENGCLSVASKPVAEINPEVYQVTETKFYS